jgi:hypothetical protein
MNETPTSGPISANMTHQERELAKSRHSFRNSHVQAPLRESKQDLLEVRWLPTETLIGKRGEIFDVSVLHEPTLAQEKETVTNSCRGSGSRGRTSDQVVRYLRNAAAASRLWRRSSPSNGSSISRTGCGERRPSARSIRLRCPFERAPTGTRMSQCAVINDSGEAAPAATEIPQTEFQDPLTGWSGQGAIASGT